MSEFSGESVALVTGAATGIGFATVKLLLAAGITKLAILDSNPLTLPTATSTLQTLHPTAVILSLLTNVSIEAEVVSAIAQTVAKFGRLDFCVNNAAIGGVPGLMEGQELNNWENVVGTNAKGVWLCEREEIRQFMKQEGRVVSTGLPLTTRGAIVNTGSVAGQAAVHQMNSYVMSKHALAGLTKADAIDYAQLGIRINCVQPGPVKTPFTQLVHETELKHLFGDPAMARPPMNRWAEPEEIAHTILFLLSDKASFVTGAVWNVDGGYGAM